MRHRLVSNILLKFLPVIYTYNKKNIVLNIQCPDKKKIHVIWAMKGTLIMRGVQYAC